MIPAFTKADHHTIIEILTAEKIIIKGDNDYIDKRCNQWELDKKDIIDFFFTAKKFITGAEINVFDIYPCEIKGNLIINGLNGKYSINLGGVAFIYGKDFEQQGFGCTDGECLKYVHYEQYSD